jgi:AraC-like DNA-binding protein
VTSIDVIEMDGGGATVLPSAGAVLGIQLAGRVRASDRLLSIAGVTGIQTVARRYDYLGPTTSILVRFTPQGAACLGPPARLIANMSVTLEDLIPASQAAVLLERLLDAPDLTTRVALVEELLLRLPYADDPLIARAIMLLTNADGDAGVAGVARRVDLSERQLERRMLERVGITPKRFASLRRFERALALARSRSSLTDAALDAGYYDQSHFIREFRRMTGAAPGAFFRPPP